MVGQGRLVPFTTGGGVRVDWWRSKNSEIYYKYRYIKQTVVMQ